MRKGREGTGCRNRQRSYRPLNINMSGYNNFKLINADIMKLNLKLFYENFGEKD